MSSRLIKGRFVIIGKQPDGDSIRFAADDPKHFEDLYRFYRMRFSGDGSIQLRLEGIDTPETHYGPNYSQPRGDEARDSLLKFLGFESWHVAGGGQTVDAASPETVRGAILTEGADANGRPISYVFRENVKMADFEDGQIVVPTPQLVADSANVAQITSGDAYLTLYTSMPKSLRAYFRDLAQQARQQGIGVWGQDCTSEFWLEGFADITPPDGQLILPKLFRRAIDYCKSDYAGGFVDWIRDRSSGSRPENDGVLLESNGFETTLAELLEDVNGWIRFKHDLLDVVFLEK